MRPTHGRFCVAALPIASAAAVTAIAGLLAAPAAPRETSTGPSVRLIYAIPSDRPFRADYRDAIEAAFADLRRWYRRQVGRTFRLYHPTPAACVLPRRAAYYTVDGWDKVLADVQPCAPVASGSTDTVWVVYSDTRNRCGDPGGLGAGTAGLTILGRHDLEGLLGKGPRNDCGRHGGFPAGRFVGGAGHELGHAFGLAHPPGCERKRPACDRDALMWEGYSAYPNTYLRPEERRKLRASRFFS